MVLIPAQHYGVHLGPVQVPCHEGMPRYTDDGLNFYYAQEDILFEKQKEKSWSHNIIRPNAIIGFTPGSKYFILSHAFSIHPVQYWTLTSGKRMACPRL